MSETAILGLVVVGALLLSKKPAPPPVQNNQGQGVTFGDIAKGAAAVVGVIANWWESSNGDPGPSSFEEAAQNANEHQASLDANARNG